MLKPVDIEEYLEYLKYYKDESGIIHTNNDRGLHRKLAALRSFFNYYYKREILKNNPTVVLDMPKTYFLKNKTRNLALFTLLLGTGIRVSECVGLDIEDIDFKNNRIKIIRKGGKEDFVYFNDEVTEALYDYYAERINIETKIGHEHAFFLSIQKRRMSVQSIEDLVKDCAKHVTTIKHITPHKLRSTYGTNLYRETGDIYLVAEVLGHNDVNTTRKHYAAMEEDRKRKAASAVKLRK